jgi:acetolactate synthase-1/2/3 large subunit
VLGGRAPAFRWGQGSLQEIDHVPFVRPLVKLAATADTTAEIPDLVDEALHTVVTAPSGPAFVDFPLDQVFMEAAEPSPPTRLPEPWTDAAVGGAGLERAVALLADAERPVIMAGTNLYWGRGEEALRSLAEDLRIPVFLNGLARGCVPADHPCAFSRARSEGLRGADVALVVGVPLDFRLGFGAAFDAEADIVNLDVAEPEREHPRSVAAELYGGLPAALEALRAGAGFGGSAAGDGTDGSGVARERERWLESLRSIETEKRAGERSELEDDRAPLHPMRVYGELADMLDRDAIVVGDGGDFVSYAGRVVDSYRPGCWLDPGPFGCLGSGPGYALAAKLARPDRQVVLLLGDGAFGFAGMEFDTLARHGVAVVGVVGNNGIWALEKHPMEFLYGYSVAAELRPATRYDKVVEALGCHGELVERPGELRPALERAFGAGRPALVNVLTDPSVAYPRRANLA